MRAIADLPVPIDGVLRALVHDDGRQTHLFLYERREDGPCSAHRRFPRRDEALAWAQRELGVARAAWREIADPGVGDRDDWIAPRRAAADGCGA